MLTKSVKTLTGILVALTAYGVSSLPADANPLQSKKEVLVSQLSGHDLYKPINSQLVLSDYAIGRIRGVVGSILFIELLKYPGSASASGYAQCGDSGQRYTHVHLPSSGAPGSDMMMPGSDVMVRRVGSGNTCAWAAYQAHPSWISRLNLKEIPTFERTAVDFESTAPVALPPVQPSAPPVYTPAPAPAPIRGMW